MLRVTLRFGGARRLAGSVALAALDIRGTHVRLYRPVEGSRLLADAQRRVATWLENEPGVQLRSDVSGLAATAVNLVVEVLNGRHVLVLRETGWRLEHDLRCRLGIGKGCPFEGPLRILMKDVKEPPRSPGRYVLGLDGKRRGQERPLTLTPEASI
jgi:hypothetical protein